MSGLINVPTPALNAFAMFNQAVVQNMEIQNTSIKAATGKEIYFGVAGIVLDSQLIFYYDSDKVRELWVKIREEDLIAEWLLYATIRWRTVTFQQSGMYDEWLSRLADGYCININDSYAIESVLDDEMADLTPKHNEFIKVLKANAWFAFLITLGLLSDNIFGLGVELSLKRGKDVFDTTSEPVKT